MNEKEATLREALETIADMNLESDDAAEFACEIARQALCETYPTEAGSHPSWQDW